MILAGCRTDEIVSVDSGDAPGNSAATLEVVLDRTDVSAWLDTVFSGFTAPVDGGFLRVEAGTSELESHGLIRFRDFPDSVLFLDTISVIQRFDSARLIFIVDHTRSSLASGGTTVQLRRLDEDWDPRSTTWQIAVDTPGVRRAWSVPGGALGGLLGAALVTADSDSIAFDLDARADSFIEAWRDTTRANPGLALVIADSGRVALGPPTLRFGVVPKLQPDTSIEFARTVTEMTFVFDPPPPALPANVLRVGGIDGWRAYFKIVLPDSVTVGGRRVSLRGSTINRADLILSSLAAPAAPFGAERSFTIGAVGLEGDPGVLGPKTPVGDRVTGSDVSIAPDSIDPGDQVRVPLTSFVQAWASQDSTRFPLRFLLRGRPEASIFGFWEFGASSDVGTRVPRLQIVFTPPTRFGVP